MEVGGRRHVELPLDITGCCTKRGGELEAGKGDTWGDADHDLNQGTICANVF